MTYWYSLWCKGCSRESPPIFLSFNGVISLYAIGDDDKKSAGEWVEEHQNHGDFILLDTDSIRPIAKPIPLK